MKYLNITGLTKLLELIDGEFAMLVSPHFSGAPTAPTQALTDKSDKIATTEYVQDYVDENCLLSSGGTMTGSIILSSGIELY